MTDELARAGDAFARIAEARAVLGAANARSGAVTCASCMASEIGSPDVRIETCRELRGDGVCQKQVWLAALTILAERITI